MSPQIVVPSVTVRSLLSCSQIAGAISNGLAPTQLFPEAVARSIFSCVMAEATFHVDRYLTHSTKVTICGR